MKLVNVIPIIKGAPHDSLLYFTVKDVQPGALVTAPLRKKIVPAIVASIKDIKDIKTGLKKTQFKLKPIKSILSASFLEPEFIEACKKIAKYFVSPLGAVIKDFVPQAILESREESSFFALAKSNRSHFHETHIIQAPKTERLQYYKSIIREEFAKSYSVFFCLPAVAEINKLSNDLQKGIEKYTVIMHGKMSAKKIREKWNNALRENHPLLIIATKSFFSLPRKDVGALIIDCESSPFYQSQKRPYIDARIAAKIFSENMRSRLIFGDFFIRSEAFHRYKSVIAYSSPRLPPEAEQIIVDMRGKNFSVISEELKKIIKKSLENNEKIILFINRRGHSPVTVCQDCLRPVLCEKCDTPLVLHKKNKAIGAWICHKCLTEKTSPEQCPYCKSHRLETLGIGIQKAAEEIKKLFPDLKIFLMDSDNIKTEKQGKKIAENFLNAPGGMLLGTEIIFSYLNKLVENVAAVSIDSLFALPDFRINEKIFYLLLKLRVLAKKTFLIQTRMPEQKLFNYATKGNISGFYMEEIEDRKKFGYPPFKTLIKITREGKNKNQIKKEIDDLTKKLQEWNPVAYPAFIPKIKNIYSWHILLKIDPESWPDNQKELHQILSSLAPSWKINVDPESLL